MHTAQRSTAAQAVQNLCLLLHSSTDKFPQAKTAHHIYSLGRALAVRRTLYSNILNKELKRKKENLKSKTNCKKQLIFPRVTVVYPQASHKFVVVAFSQSAICHHIYSTMKTQTIICIRLFRSSLYFQILFKRQTKRQITFHLITATNTNK